MHKTHKFLYAMMVLMVLAYPLHAIEVIVQPNNFKLNPGEFAYLAAHAVNEQGQIIPAEFTWQVSPSGFGAITPYGRFTAGPGIAEGLVIATTQIGGTTYDGSAEVRIDFANPQKEVVINPPAATLPAGETLDFNAALMNPGGQTMPVQQWWWFVDPPGHGFVDPMGVFHAGPVPGQTSVVAECMMGVHLFNAAVPVTVTPAPDYWVQVMPPNAFVPAGGEFQFNATLFNPMGDPVPGLTWEWWVTPPDLGTVDSTGHFEAGPGPGEGFVHAGTQYQGSDYEGQSHVIVSPPPPPPGSVLFGSVTDDQTGLPIAGGWVMAIPLIGGPPHLSPTGPEGHYEIPGVAPGAYFLQCWADDYLGEFFENVYSWLEADSVIVEAGVPTEINFALQPQVTGSNTIVGRVLDDAGGPIADASLYLLNEAGDVVNHAVTLDDGSYSLSCAAGIYYAKADAALFEVQYYFDAAFLAQATSVNVGSGLGADAIDFRLSPQSPTGLDPNAPNGSVVEYRLGAARPNPFNPMTTISYDLPEAGSAILSVYDLTGKYIATLLNGHREAGSHEVTFDATGMASGIYIYRLQAGSFASSGKMVLLK